MDDSLELGLPGNNVTFTRNFIMQEEITFTLLCKQSCNLFHIKTNQIKMLS